MDVHSMYVYTYVYVFIVFCVVCLVCLCCFYLCLCVACFCTPPSSFPTHLSCGTQNDSWQLRTRYLKLTDHIRYLLMPHPPIQSRPLSTGLPRRLQSASFSRTLSPTCSHSLDPLHHSSVSPHYCTVCHCALHSDHNRQVPLVGAGCFRQVTTVYTFFHLCINFRRSPSSHARVNPSRADPGSSSSSPSW